MRKSTCTALLACLLLGSSPAMEAGRLGYPPSEFTARRQALAERVKGGLVVLFGGTMPSIASRFRQDNDFYYFTGNEDINAIFVMDAATKEAHLFLPEQGPNEIRADGHNWLASAEERAKTWGFSSIQPTYRFNEFLASKRGAGGPQDMWLRLSERDEVSQGRGNKAANLARRFSHPLGGPASEDAWWAATIRSRYPFYGLKDVTPEIDQLRVIKSSREIEIIKENGRISAEGIRRAITITATGRFEYELEAEATHEMIRNGVQGAGYGAIVGSGPNVNIWHYRENGRQLQIGDLVVMDYGGALDYQVVDITRTWPVAGRFDDLQLRAYRAALEAQEAIIAAMKPGATRSQTREIGRAIFAKHGFEDQRAPGAGHFVGMSVHDVGDSAAPFQPGMVIAVEPIIEIKEKQLHVRIEDTVVITDNGPLIVSDGVPKKVDELLALLQTAREKTASRLFAPPALHRSDVPGARR